MILGGIALRAAFKDTWLAYRCGSKMTKDELEKVIGPNSIDVTLGTGIMRQVSVNGAPIDPLNPNDSDRYVPESMESYRLRPGDFILGCTQERFATDKPLTINMGMGKPWGSDSEIHIHKETYFVQKYDGRSTMGRLGVASHVTAGFGDYGFRDHWTLEIVNLGTQAVKLYAGMKIGQISFEAVHQPLNYTGAYTDMSRMPKPRAPKLGHGRF